MDLGVDEKLKNNAEPEKNVGFAGRKKMKQTNKAEQRFWKHICKAKV